MLRADRQADGTLEDSLVRQFGLRELGMRRRGGMDDQGLHVGHIRQEGKDFQRVDEPVGLLFSALDLEREDGPASVREIPLVEGMVGMAGKGGMIDLRHLGVAGQVFHDLQGIGDMPFHPQGQSFHALQKDESAYRREGGAGIPEQDSPGPGDVGGRPYGVGKNDPVVAVIGLGELRELAGSLPVELAGVHDDAADGRSVSADELGGGVDDDVGAVFDGPQQEGRREGIVDHQRDSVPMGDGRHGFDVDEVGIRVAEGFNEDEFGLGTDGLLEIREVGRVHEGGRHPVGDQRMLEQVIRAAIDGLG